MGTTLIRNCITLCFFTIVFGNSTNQNIDEKGRKGKQGFFGYSPYPYYVRRPSYAIPFQPFYTPYQRSPYYSPIGYPFQGFSQFLPFRSNTPIIRVASPSVAPVSVISPQIFPLRRGEESLVGVDPNLDDGTSNKLNNYATVLSAVSIEDDEKNVNKTDELLHLLVHKPYTGSVEVDHPIEPPKVETIYDSLKEQFSNEKNPLQNINDGNTEVEYLQGNESQDISFGPADIFVKYQQDNTLHAAENHEINEAPFDTDKENFGFDGTLKINKSGSSDEIQNGNEETYQDNIYKNNAQSIEENQEDDGSLSSLADLNNEKAEDKEASGVEIIALIPKIASDMEVTPLDALDSPNQEKNNEEQTGTKYTHQKDAESIQENQHKNYELQALSDVNNGKVEDEESSQVETGAIVPETVFDEEKELLDQSNTTYQIHKAKEQTSQEETHITDIDSMKENYDEIHDFQVATDINKKKAEDEKGTQIEIMDIVPNAAFDKQKNPLVIRNEALSDDSDLNKDKNIVSSNLNAQNEDIDEIQIHTADGSSVVGKVHMHSTAQSSEAIKKKILPALTKHDSDGTVIKQDNVEKSLEEEPIEKHVNTGESSEFKGGNEQKEFSAQPGMTISNQEGIVVADVTIFSEYDNEKAPIEDTTENNNNQPTETRDSEVSEIKMENEEADILGQPASSIINNENEEKNVANDVILSDSSNQKIAKEGTTGNDPDDKPIQMDDSDSSSSKLENEPIDFLVEPTSSVLNEQNEGGAVADVAIVPEINDGMMTKEDNSENSHNDETVEIHDFDSSDSKIENEQKKLLVEPMSADLNQEQIIANVEILSNGQTKMVTKEDITGNSHNEEPAEIHDNDSNDAKIENEQANILAPIAPLVVSQDEEAKIVTSVKLLSDSNNGKVTKVGTMETDNYEKQNEVTVSDVTDSRTDNEDKINSLQPILSVLNQEREGTIVKDITIISDNPIYFGSSIPDDNILDKKEDEIAEQNEQHFPTKQHQIENNVDHDRETIQDLVFEQHQIIEDSVSHGENNVMPKDNTEVFDNEALEKEKGISNINDKVYNLQSFESENLADQYNTKDIMQQDNTIKILQDVLDEQNDPENADEKPTESYISVSLDESLDTKAIHSQVGQNNISEEPLTKNQQIYNIGAIDIGFDLANKDLDIVTLQDDIFADGDELESIEDDWSAFRGILEDFDDWETTTQSSFNYEKKKILNDGSNSDSSFTDNRNSLNNKESPIVLANGADSHEPPISTSTELSNTLLNMLKDVKEHQYEKVAGDYSSVNTLENMITKVRDEMSDLEQLYSTLTVIELSGNALFDSEQDELLDDKLQDQDNRLEELNSIYTKYAENLKEENLNEHKETVLAMLRFYSNGVAMLERMKEGLKPKESSIVVKETATLKVSDSDQISFQETNKKGENLFSEFLLNELKNIQMDQINNVAGEYTTSEGLEKMIESVSKERNDLINLFSLLVETSRKGNTLEPERMSDAEISPQLYKSQINKVSSHIRRHSSQLNEANLDTHKSYVLSMITRDDNFLEDLLRMRTYAKSNNLHLQADEIINMDQATFENSYSLQDSENISAPETPPMFPFPEDELVIIPTVNEKVIETEYGIVADSPKSTLNLLPVPELANEETLEANSEDQDPLKSSNSAQSIGKVADVAQTDLTVPQNSEKLQVQKTPPMFPFADHEVMSAFDGKVNEKMAETLAGSNNFNLDPVPFKKTEEEIEENLKYRDPSEQNNPALSTDEMTETGQTTLEQSNALQDSKRNSEHQDVDTEENDASVVALVEIIEKVPGSTNKAVEDDKVDISQGTESEATENMGMKIKESSELFPTMDHPQETTNTAADEIVGETPRTKYAEGENFKKAIVKSSAYQSIDKIDEVPNDSDLALDNSSEQGVKIQRVNEQLDGAMDLEILQDTNSNDKLEPVKSNPVITGITPSQDSQQVKTLNIESNVNEWQPHESTVDIKSHQLLDLSPNNEDVAPSNEDEDPNLAGYTSDENDYESENSEVSAIIEVVEEIDNNQPQPIRLDSAAKEELNEVEIPSHQVKETADILGSAEPESNIAADYVVRLIQEGVSHTNNIVDDVNYRTEANKENDGEPVKVIQSNEDTVKEQDSSTWFVRPNQDFNDNTNTNEDKYVSEHEDSHDFALLSDDAPAEKTHAEWTVKVQPYEEGRPPVKVIGFTAADSNSDYSSPNFEVPDETLSSRPNNKVLQEAEENFFVIKDQVVQHSNPQVPDNARPEYLYDAPPVPVEQVLPNEHSASILLDDGTIVKAAKENDRPLILSNTDNLKYRKIVVYEKDGKWFYAGDWRKRKTL